MSQKSIFVCLIVILSLLLGGAWAVGRAAAPAQPRLAPAGSLPGYTYNARLEVRNNAASILPAGYTVGFTLDTAALVSGGRLRSDCDDLRVSFSDTAEVELDRLISNCNTTSTQVQFRTQASIDSLATDTRYTLNYGDPLAGTPPQNPANVYAIYDDFQDGDANGWTPAKGTWAVFNDAGNYVYRYTDGGANWALTYASLPASDIDYLAKIRATDSPLTNWIGLSFRIQDQNNFLTFYQSRDADQFKFARVVNDVHTVPLNPPFTMSANAWYWLRLQALGSQVRARIWADGDPEPVSWTIDTTETMFQSSSNIGLTLYNHTTNADWDDVQVRRLAAVEPTVTLSPWWDNNYGFRRYLTVTNTSGAASLQQRFSARFVLDTATLVGNGQMLPDCADLRMVYDPGLSPVEIDRVVENCNSSQTTVWFALQRPVVASGQDLAYTLYYGNASASAPPANGMNVFLFFEDWEQGTAHWTNAGGLDAGNSGTMGTSAISTNAALSPSHSQLFTTRAAGGDAFSGYIPVASSTGYAVSVWASTPSSNVCAPVGFDPYTSTYVKGPETWFWTDNWPTPSAWMWRSYSFTTAADTAYLKIKSELWDNPACLGSAVYLDNLAVRYSISSDPTLVLSDEDSFLQPITITNIQDNGPLVLGNTLHVTADIAATQGTISSATLRILSPQVVDVPMSLFSGTTTNGSWQADFTPNQGGVYTYQILAVSGSHSRLSPLRTFTVSDSISPVIALVSVINPILVNNTQTLVVQVTDNGVLSSVNVTVDGNSHPMTANGNQYSYAWKVATLGTIPYSVTAADSSSNTSTYSGSFVSQPRDVDVCTWKDCRKGAASWSIDDGISGCLSNLTAAGIHGTYYYNGVTTNSWFSTYSAAGMEIASHTVSHPCDTPGCSPTCTPASLAAIPVDPAVVSAYRLNQLEPNIAAIQAGTNQPVLSLAWPCGCSDPSRWSAASYYYLGARGYSDYVANLTWLEDVNLPTPFNIFNLNTAAAYRQDFVDQAYAEGKWSITTSHGSCDGIDYLGAQNANGHLWVAPVGEVLKYIQVRDASQFNNYNRSGRTISFDAVHNLPTFQPTSITTPTPYTFLPIVFDNPVTLKIHLLDVDSVLSVMMDDVPVTSYVVQTLDGTRFITFDAALNTSHHVVVNLAAPAPAISAVTATNPVELGSQAQVSATVIPGEGTTLGTVTLRVLSPETNDYPMSVVSGDQYSASFTPAQLGVYTYQVIATNSEGTPSQSSPASFTVVDTTPPSSQAQSQSYDQIAAGDPNVLSAQGRDPGGLARAILSTNESGTWQDFDWPVSDWWNHSWAHRRAVTVTEAAGLARTNETVDLLISSDTFSGLTSCVNELRVADQARNELPVQVYDEQVNGGVRTCHLLFQATVGANASRTYYVYYGNPTAVAPTYTTDLNVTSAGNVRTVQNSFFNLDLDSVFGIISRLRLLQGSNINLPLSTTSNLYWGWHQVCSTAHGNITGKNSLCQGGPAPATGLTFVETLAGPLVREYTLTSVKDVATYTIKFRFFANTPYYQYSLARSGTNGTIMNNFWYLNGNFSRLGIGTGGTPSTVFNTYDNDGDHVRIASFGSVDVASIDGLDNDGSDLGGTDYRFPTATGLSLSVVTGADQTATQGVLSQINTPLTSPSFGDAENAPTGQYGSPIELTPGTDWTTTSFTWQNPAIAEQSVSWRIKYCDVSGNCSYTPTMSFWVNAAYSITLQPGWNLVSIPLHPLDTDPSAVLASLGINYDIVYAWHGPTQSWLLFDRNVPPFFNTLTSIDCVLGYWIHITSSSPVQLNVGGSTPSTTDIPLAIGWNLVGYPSASPGPLPDILRDHGVGSNFSLVYAYHANEIGNEWKIYDPSVPPIFQTLPNLSPGWGYWILVTTESVWHVIY
jgi:hypothetical protein